MCGNSTISNPIILWKLKWAEKRLKVGLWDNHNLSRWLSKKNQISQRSLNRSNLLIRQNWFWKVKYSVIVFQLFALLQYQSIDLTPYKSHFVSNSIYQMLHRKIAFSVQSITWPHSENHFFSVFYIVSIINLSDDLHYHDTSRDKK